MKVVILAGGYGTRISEESRLVPKPMIEIGGMPILVHIMKMCSAQGFNDFIICAGYRQQQIKEYFAHYFLYSNDVTFNLETNEQGIHRCSGDAWRVTVADTGLDTQTGGRILRIKEYIGDEPFLLTYGDAVGDIDLKALLARHAAGGKICTMTCYNFGQSKGVVEVGKAGDISAFREKSSLDGNLINIGYMVCEPGIFRYITKDCALEDGPLKALVKDKQIDAYIHKGFWQCMDTMNEKEKLESLWATGHAPWKIWKD